MYRLVILKDFFHLYVIGLIMSNWYPSPKNSQVTSFPSFGDTNARPSCATHPGCIYHTSICLQFNNSSIFQLYYQCNCVYMIYLNNYYLNSIISTTLCTIYTKATIFLTYIISTLLCTLYTKEIIISIRSISQIICTWPA